MEKIAPESVCLYYSLDWKKKMLKLIGGISQKTYKLFLKIVGKLHFWIWLFSLISYVVSKYMHQKLVKRTIDRRCYIQIRRLKLFPSQLPENWWWPNTKGRLISEWNFQLTYEKIDKFLPQNLKSGQTIKVAHIIIQL